MNHFLHNLRNAGYEPHKHDFVTTHYIISGSFIVVYPDDDPEERHVFGPGSRVDVPIGKVHKVWAGEDGCKMIVGSNGKDAESW